jgi:hypothetical protein
VYGRYEQPMHPVDRGILAVSCFLAAEPLGAFERPFPAPGKRNQFGDGLLVLATRPRQGGCTVCHF